MIAARQASADAGGSIPIYVATDDDRIAAEADRLGAKVVMTEETCRNGTERVAQAVERLSLGTEIVINLQGDAPLTPPWFVSALIAAMRRDPMVQVATPVLRCDVEAVTQLIEDRRHGRVGATTVVSDNLGRALYFSKEVLPFTNGKGVVDATMPVFHHVGLYAYRPSALHAYGQWKPGLLEQLEGLEQLRFLENGYPMNNIEVFAQDAKFWELNNPSDVPSIEHYLDEMGWD